MAQVRRLGPRVGGRLALFCSHHVIPGVRRPCSDFMDMVRRFINCRIIIIIKLQASLASPAAAHCDTCPSSSSNCLIFLVASEPHKL